ncbi:MAG: hypothetical protein P1V51_09775 [Deltaproteobacteria bacterium]|nr:hypothetical protein [Deltaproteobacteria bacterium]
MKPSITRLLLLSLLLLPLGALAQQDGPLEKVTVKVTQEGEPVAGLALRLIGEPPGGGQITYGEGTTDAAGLFVVDVPFRVGVVLFAEGRFDGVKFTSPEKAFAGQPGAGLSLEMKVFSSSSASIADLSFGPDSHVQLENMGNRLEITEVFFIQNASKSAFSPEGGLAIPLAKGFKNVTGVGGNPVFQLEHVGASVPGPFMPGQTEVQVRYDLPLDSSTVRFEQKVEVPWSTARAFMQEEPGLEFTGPQVERQELRESNGRQWRLATLRPQSGTLSFTINNLEVRSQKGRWYALVLSLLVALVGFGFGLAPVKDEQLESAARKGLLQERDTLLADLEELERDRAEGRIDEEAFTEDRQAAIDQLAAVLRTLESTSAEPQERP